MEKHDLIHMLNCRLEQEQGKPAFSIVKDAAQSRSAKKKICLPC